MERPTDPNFLGCGPFHALGGIIMITIVMGRPGAGKSTYLAICAREHIKKGKKVYSNVYIKGCLKIEPREDFNFYELADGLVIIDEAGFEFNNRNWKQFGDQMYRFFTMHRHYNLDIILAVQMWDRVDMCIREVTQKIVIVEPTILARWFVKARSVECLIGIQQGQIVEIFQYAPILAGGLQFKYRKGAMSMFNSYYRDTLLYREFDKWDELQIIPFWKRIKNPHFLPFLRVHE